MPNANTNTNPTRSNRVPQAVHDYLSEQSHKGNEQGGQISSLLIEMGKEVLAEKYGDDWRDGIQKELKARQSKAS